jgi:alpha-D-xyloside xylohydrolase
MQRALPMDWPADQRVRDIGDQFMFGPAFLVAPVTEPGAAERSVYLPPAAGWYDFWTGQKLEGGKTVLASTPLDRLPLYVRAGSIVPLGPVVENADSQVTELEVRVYPGADADFDYYSDAGDSYDYEKGQHRVIPMHWDDSSRTLTLEKAQGAYPSMPKKLQIRLVIVDGSGAARSDGEAVYDGATLHVRSRV